MPLEYLRDGDVGFVGLNSRDNPAALPKGIVSKSQNFRLDRGVATVRKGLKRKTSSTIAGQTIYGIGCYLDGNGQEIFVIIVTNGLYTYNPETEIYSTKVNFPAGETIITQDGCDVVTAVDKVYITRGHSKRPLIATINTTSYSITSVTASPTSGTGNAFPNCVGLLYYANRLIAMGQDHTLGYSPTARARDSICVSNYLDFDNWDSLDVFNFNEGTNDEVVAVAPWTLNEFVVFLRNSIYYVNVGSGRYVYSDPLNSTAYSRIVASDTGCVAKRSIVSANGGIIFLSNNGVYMMNPQQVGTNESMRLITDADPLSAPINDVIQRINRNYAYRAVGIYWNNRYYLAVPLDGSTDNNCILVYNFILKNWESVDTYPAGFDIFRFVVGKKSNQSRLFGFDTDEGVFLLEELEYDEYGASTGTPILPFYLPATLSLSSFLPNQIQSELITRLYDFGNLRDKRFSSVEVDILVNSGSQLKTTAITINPDTSTLVDNFGSSSDEDSTRRIATRKIGYGLQLKFNTNNLRSSIRAINAIATVLGKQNISKK